MSCRANATDLVAAEGAGGGSGSDGGWWGGAVRSDGSDGSSWDGPRHLSGPEGFRAAMDESNPFLFDVLLSYSKNSLKKRETVFHPPYLNNPLALFFIKMQRTHALWAVVTDKEAQYVHLSAQYEAAGHQLAQSQQHMQETMTLFARDIAYLRVDISNDFLLDYVKTYQQKIHRLNVEIGVDESRLADSILSN